MGLARWRQPGLPNGAQLGERRWKIDMTTLRILERRVSVDRIKPLTNFPTVRTISSLPSPRSAHTSCRSVRNRLLASRACAWIGRRSHPSGARNLFRSSAAFRRLLRNKFRAPVSAPALSEPRRSRVPGQSRGEAALDQEASSPQPSPPEDERESLPPRLRV